MTTAAAPKTFQVGDPVKWVKVSRTGTAVDFNTLEGKFVADFSEAFYQVRARNNRKVLVPKADLQHASDRGHLTEALFPTEK